jgi:hypothetical protein
MKIVLKLKALDKSLDLQKEDTMSSKLVEIHFLLPFSYLNLIIFSNFISLIKALLI